MSVADMSRTIAAAGRRHTVPLLVASAIVSCINSVYLHRERDDAIATRNQMAGWYMDQERRYAAQTWEISALRRDLDACHDHVWVLIDRGEP